MSTGGRMDSVRRFYGVPAYRGRRVTYRGYRGRPVNGRIISSTGSHLYMRTDEGERFGPLHPTCAMDYGDGRNYTTETNALIAIRNDWLNKRITTEEYHERCAAAAPSEGSKQ